MAKSYVRGQEAYYDGEFWRYSDTQELIKNFPREDYPDVWTDRCSGDGHKHYRDDNGDLRYIDDNALVAENSIRPCKKCGHYPTDKGQDYCIQNLGYVVNACCGHGTNEGYIMFDDGTVIRGHFTVERPKGTNIMKNKNPQVLIGVNNNSITVISGVKSLVRSKHHEN